MGLEPRWIGGCLARIAALKNVRLKQEDMNVRRESRHEVIETLRRTYGGEGQRVQRREH